PCVARGQREGSGHCRIKRPCMANEKARRMPPGLEWEAHRSRGCPDWGANQRGAQGRFEVGKGQLPAGLASVRASGAGSVGLAALFAGELAAVLAGAFFTGAFLAAAVFAAAFLAAGLAAFFAGAAAFLAGSFLATAFLAGAAFFTAAFLA